MSRAIRRLMALGAALAALGPAAAPAWGLGEGEPLFTFVPAGGGVPAPVGYFAGPCGLAVDSSGDFYVSDYYHRAIDVYDGHANYTQPGATGATGYITQLAGEDPLDGPCGLALGSGGSLYVNNLDRNVVGFGAAPAFGSGTAIAGAEVDSSHPTGVAVDPTTNDVYVDERTYITGYDAGGAQLMDGPDPLKLGQGSLGEGYGLAIDAAGRLYAADAADDTVKAYDPGAADKSTPAQTIGGPPGGFASLRHAALAVDRLNGVLYVVDDLQSQYTEQPAAQVDVYDPSLPPPNDWGVLKYQIVDALPPGIAVDQASGRVYVTSGNTDQAGIYAYAAGSQVSSSSPPSIGLEVSAVGTGRGTVTSSLGGLDCTGTCSAEIRSAADVALTATPAPGSSFTGWSGGGGCEGSEVCAVAMDRARAVEAEFQATPGAEPAGDGSGAESSSPASAPIAPSPKRHRHHARRRHHTKRRHHRVRR